MEFPCGKCPIIQKHIYGHYYGICDNCKRLEKYNLWKEKQELKRWKDKILQKSKYKNNNNVQQKLGQ